MAERKEDDGTEQRTLEMTQLESARQGIVTDAMRTVASEEQVAVETVRAAVADGTAAYLVWRSTR